MSSPTRDDETRRIDGSVHIRTRHYVEMLPMDQSLMMQTLYFSSSSVVSRALCAMRVFDVRASSSPRKLPLRQISFRSHPPLLSSPPQKNCILDHSPSLFNAPEMESLALQN